MQTKVLTVGNDSANLDIFLTANSIPVSGKYVGFQLFDAANAQVVSGVALNPSIGHYTGSGIIPAGFQLGDWHIGWTIITLGNGLQFSSEPFTVQDVEIQIGFQPETDTTGSLYEAIRIDVGDPEGDIFNDDLIKRILIKAVRRLNQKLGLSITTRPRGVPGNLGGLRLRVPQLQLDVEAGTISPDNAELEDLIILQSEVIILGSEVSALKRLQASGPFGLTKLNAEGISVQNADQVNVTLSPVRLTFRSELYRFDLQQKQKELDDCIKMFWNRQIGNYSKLVWG